MKFSLPQPNALAAILGAAAPQTEVANNSAPSAVSRDQMEAAARARGYRSYDHMIYSMRNRLPPPKIPGSNTVPAQGGIMNVLHQIYADPRGALANAFSWHPSSTLGRVNDALAGANGE
jgi:hypothetical protein